MPIGDIPILEIILRQLKQHGFSEVVLATGYLAQLIEAYLSTSAFARELNIRYHHETEPLGTAGALAGIENLEDTFLVMNGDILTGIDYSDLIAFHKRKEAAVTIAVLRKRLAIEYGVLALDDQGRLQSWTEKPVHEYDASTGIYVCEPSVLRGLDAGQYLDFPTLVRRLMERGETVLGYRTQAFWLDMGNKEDYEEAIHVFQKDRAAFGIH
jgi:NDP-sugar pyrophosphorylase family protein